MSKSTYYAKYKKDASVSKYFNYTVTDKSKNSISCYIKK